MACGVYQIVCEPTGRRYIGSTSMAFAQRWKVHRRALRRGRHHSPRLQRSWDKYGEDAFRFEVLEICEPEQAVSREQHWLDTEKPEFNTAKIAYSCLGVRRTPEQRERYAAAARQRHAEGRGATHGLIKYVQSEEHREWARRHAVANAEKAVAGRKKQAAKLRAGEK